MSVDYATALRTTKTTLKILMDLSGPFTYLQQAALYTMSDDIEIRLNAARYTRVVSDTYLKALGLYTDAPAPASAKKKSTGTKTKEESDSVPPEGAPAEEVSPEKAEMVAELEGFKKAREERFREIFESRPIPGLTLPTPAPAAGTSSLLPTSAPASPSATTLPTTLPTLAPANAPMEAPESPEVNLYQALEGLSEADRWWIYHQALLNIEKGFDAFVQEHIVSLALEYRTKMIEDRRATGIAADVNVGTYGRHDLGQYDVHAGAGSTIIAAQPDTVDLIRVLGPRQSGQKERLFAKVEGTSKVVYAKQGSAKNDALAKLTYGYFGRDWDWKQIQSYLEGTLTGKIPDRTPDASRVIAGLLFRNVIVGSSLDKALVSELETLRDMLDKEIRAELLKDPKLSLPSGRILMKTIDASTGWFEGLKTIQPAVLKSLKDQGVKNPSYKVMVAGETVLSDPSSPATIGIEKLMKSVYLDLASATSTGAAKSTAAKPKKIVSRGGPMVQVSHQYEEVLDEAAKESGVTPKRVWIMIDYIHLSQVDVTKGTALKMEEEPQLGLVGSTGNAVSPHVHMSIGVHLTEPKASSTAVGYLQPIDFYKLIERR